MRTGKTKWTFDKTHSSIKFDIDRTDFRLKYNSLLEPSGPMPGEEVTITCKVELLKQK